MRTKPCTRPEELACQRAVYDLGEDIQTIKAELSEIKATATIAAQAAEIAKQIFDKLFVGNGLPPVMTRLDRIEQWMAACRKHIWVIYLAILGLLFGVAGEWVKSKVIPTPESPTIQSIHQKK